VKRTITTLDGESREVECCPDGSWSCPFCGAAVFHEHPTAYIGADDVRAFEEGKCPNPQCLAGVRATPEFVARVRRERAEQAERIADIRRRAEFHDRYITSEREREAAARKALLAEAERLGVCPVCILGYHHKRTKHRIPWQEYHRDRPVHPGCWNVDPATIGGTA
jgi:hypothetical protein